MVSAFSIVDIETDVPELDVLYLDHDPVQAAHYVADQHTKRAVYMATVLLSNAWWGAPGSEVVWGLPNLLRLPSGLYAYATGGRVPTPADRWVQGSVGNYRWVWRYGVAVAARVGAPLAPLGALEAPPPQVPEQPQTEPPVPRVWSRQFVQEGGIDYVDAVASYRAYYRAKARTLSWAGRLLPEFMF